MNILSRLKSILNDNIPARSLQVSNIIRFIFSLLVGIILIKMGVEKSIVGRLEFFLFLSVILSNFLIFGFKNGLLSYYEDLKTDQKSNFLFIVFVILFVLGIVMGLVTWFLSTSLLADRLVDYNISSYHIMLSIYVGLSIPASLGDYFLLLRSKYNQVIWYGLIFSLLQFMALVIPFILGYGLTEAIILLVIMTALKCIVSLMISAPWRSWGWNRPMAMTFIVFSVPLILQVLLGFAQEFVDGWIVSSYYPEEMFAHFRYGAKELPFSMLLISGLVASMIPAYKKSKSEALSVIKKESTRLIKFLFTLAAVLVFLSPVLFTWAYDSSFVVSAQIFNVYLLMLLSRVFLPHIIIFGSNKNWVLPAIVLVELIVNITLSLLLLPHFGILGVAFATIVANFVEKSIMIIYVDRKLGIGLSQYLDIKTYLSYASILIFAFVGSLFLHGSL